MKTDNQNWRRRRQEGIWKVVRFPIFYKKGSWSYSPTNMQYSSLEKDSKGDSEIIRTAFLLSKVGVIVKWVSTGQKTSGQVCRGGTTQAMGARLVHRKSCGWVYPHNPRLVEPLACFQTRRYAAWWPVPSKAMGAGMHWCVQGAESPSQEVWKAGPVSQRAEHQIKDLLSSLRI